MYDAIIYIICLIAYLCVCVCACAAANRFYPIDATKLDNRNLLETCKILYVAYYFSIAKLISKIGQEAVSKIDRPSFISRIKVKKPFLHLWCKTH